MIELHIFDLRAKDWFHFGVLGQDGYKLMHVRSVCGGGGLKHKLENEKHKSEAVD